MARGLGVEKRIARFFAGTLRSWGETLGLENVVRGDSVFSPGAESRLQSPGAAAISLIDDLTDKASKDCPVAAALTDADRAKLLQIKQGIEKAGKS
jgi:hypothetical protein